MIEWSNVKLLIVDDERDLLELLVQRLRRKGCLVTGFTLAQDALAYMSKHSVDIGIYDINLPDIDGVELLKKTRLQQPDMEVIMLTGHGTVETAIETMKIGAYDYLRKPYALSELEAVIAKAWEKKRLKEANIGLKHALLAENNRFSIIGESKAIKDVLELTERLADRDVPVLIEGESGTGKELIAKALHFWSYRAAQPFIAINTGALPENLLESELFGHTKGAFTGAIADKKGLVEVADQGTLFLDEVGEMPLNLQVKLLRFLESQEFRRVGDSHLYKVNVRVVAATNRVLEQEVAKGNFRQDLFYRLNVMKLLLPPLRERLADVPLLVRHFLTQYARGKQISISSEAMLALTRYRFPGNVRELSHMIERGIILARNQTIGVRDLLIPETNPTANSDNNLVSLDELERRHISKVLTACHGNKTKTARVLGISLRNLYRKIEEYQI